MQVDSFSTSVNRQTIDRCVPFFSPELARTRPYSFAPSLVVVHGQLMIATLTNTNDVATATITGTPVSGTQTLALTNPLTLDVQNAVIPYNATAAVAQGVVNALPGFAGNLTVGGGPWPGTALTFTGAGSFANRNIPVATVGASTLSTGTTAVAHTTPGATANQATPYSGSGVPIGPSEYDVATDAFGGITLGPTSGVDIFGAKIGQAPIWVKGEFLVADLLGVDAAAVTALGRCEPPLGQTGAVLHID